MNAAESAPPSAQGRAAILDPSVLDAIRQSVEAACAAGGDAAGDILPALRARFAGVLFSQCSEDDIPARLSPALPAEGFDLYLMDARDHCITLTSDLAAASGVVIAWREEDEA